MMILPIAGKAGHGKDTFAVMLKEELEKLNKRVLILHYADYVKMCASLYYGWDGKKDEKGRSLLQWLGTDFVRSYDSNFWVDTVIRLISVFQNEFDVFLIPDARMLNEIMLPYDDCWDICIKRFNEDGTDYRNPLMTEEQLRHESETALDDYSFSFYISSTSGDFERLKDQAKQLASYLFER